MHNQTKQEEFWRGDFGNEYIERNTLENVYKNIALFSDILRHTQGIKTCLEFGANIGLNLIALQALIPQIQCAAVEINHAAAERLRENVRGIEVFEQPIRSYEAGIKYDFVLAKGILIHINPDELCMRGGVYQKLYDASSKYICIAEYYNPVPVMVTYRGHKERLYKRDFCGEFMDRFPDVRLIDYGFCYHRDHNFPQDDITWFLLEK